MQVHFQTFDLPLEHPFTISRGTVTTQSTLIVRAEYRGHVGLGEATTNTYYGVTIDSMQAALDAVAGELEGYVLENPAELWKQLSPKLSKSPFAQCALDCAVWDVYGKLHEKPLWQLWGFEESDPYPPSCFTIGLDTIEVMQQKLAENPDWPVYKIKVGPDGGLERVRALRECTQAKFRVDANCAWEADSVLEYAEQLAALGVELIEQPLPADQYDAMRGLKGKAAIPLMADESCQVEADVDRCIPCFDAINIKLVKCGGLSPARRMIARAKQRGLQVMVGCMTESSVGISAGVHLLPLLDYADLDGALLLDRDIATGLNWRAGYCQLPTEAGLGVKLLG